LYITVSAVVDITIATILLGLPLNPALAVIGLVTFAVYTNDRVADADVDAISDPDKAAFVERHGHVLRPLADVAYGVAVMIAVAGGPLALLLTLLPGVFWVFYASGWFGTLGGSLSRLKELLVINTTVVALAWAVVLTFLPLAFASATPDVAVPFVFGYLFLRVFMLVELSNVLDVESDRAVGVDTIPALFGVDWTRRALAFVNVATGAVIAGALAAAGLSVPAALALLVGVGYSLGVTMLLGRWENLSATVQAAEVEQSLVLVLLVLPL
jgi:4-hydroxybenzoate polyprenyltransferase